MSTQNKHPETDEQKMERLGALSNHLRDYLTGYLRQGDKAALLAEMSNWRIVARQEVQRRQYGLINSLDDDIVQALATGELDFHNELEFVQSDLTIAKTLDIAKRPASPQGDGDCPAAVAAIALSVLELSTLETRNSDSLDFHSLAVWLIKAALIEAYRCGGADALAAQGENHA